MTTKVATIGEIDRVLGSLPKGKKSLFDRIYHWVASTGQLRLPPTMEAWVVKTFGSLEAVESQRIVRMTNRYTLEGTLFNHLRASRPMPPRLAEDPEAWLDHVGPKGDPFDSPLEATPEDLFGRVEGGFGVTAANVAKYDTMHGLVVFKRHNPLSFTKAELFDYLDTAKEWLAKAHQQRPQAVYPFVMWNCLWRAGASIAHGHLQMTLAEGMPYTQVEQLRRAAEAYCKDWASDYFNDLYKVHRSLDCALEYLGVKVMAYLTPRKEREVVLIHKSADEPLYEALYGVLQCFMQRLGVHSFNMAIFMPPLAEDSLFWEGFPVMVRIVDRGDLQSRTSDIGGMELYGQNVVASDPFQLARELFEAFP